MKDLQDMKLQQVILAKKRFTVLILLNKNIEEKKEPMEELILLQK